MATQRQPLDDKELVLIAFLHDFFHINHQLPTLHAIASARKCSTSAAAYRLRKLEFKGYIEKNVLGSYRFADRRATLMPQGVGL